MFCPNVCSMSASKIDKEGTWYLSKIDSPAIVLHEPQDRWSSPRMLSFDGSLWIHSLRLSHHTKGKERKTEQFQGGTIAVDHTSSKIYVYHQVSLRAGETLQAKQSWKNNLLQYGFHVKRYHSDNGVFRSAEFKTDLKRKNQVIDFSGTSAHHQNSVAERAIRTVVEWARMMILHAALYWPEEANLKLWSLAMDYAIHIWNNTPNYEHGLTPDEFISQTLEHMFNTFKNSSCMGMSRICSWANNPRWTKTTKMEPTCKERTIPWLLQRSFHTNWPYSQLTNKFNYAPVPCCIWQSVHDRYQLGWKWCLTSTTITRLARHPAHRDQAVLWSRGHWQQQTTSHSSSSCTGMAWKQFIKQLPNKSPNQRATISSLEGDEFSQIQRPPSPAELLIPNAPDNIGDANNDNDTKEIADVDDND